jgi:hypothetical protein
MNLTIIPPTHPLPPHPQPQHSPIHLISPPPSASRSHRSQSKSQQSQQSPPKSQQSPSQQPKPHQSPSPPKNPLNEYYKILKYKKKLQLVKYMTYDRLITFNTQQLQDFYSLTCLLATPKVYEFILRRALLVFTKEEIMESLLYSPTNPPPFYYIPDNEFHIYINITKDVLNPKQQYETQMYNVLSISPEPISYTMPITPIRF